MYDPLAPSCGYMKTFHRVCCGKICSSCNSQINMITLGEKNKQTIKTTLNHNQNDILLNLKIVIICHLTLMLHLTVFYPREQTRHKDPHKIVRCVGYLLVTGRTISLFPHNPVNIAWFCQHNDWTVSQPSIKQDPTAHRILLLFCFTQLCKTYNILVIPEKRCSMSPYIVYQMQYIKKQAVLVFQPQTLCIAQYTRNVLTLMEPLIFWVEQSSMHHVMVT